MESIDELRKLAKSFAADRDWDQFHNPKDLAISLSLEAAEVLEHFQWKDQEETKSHVKNNKQELSYELADVLIYLLLLSNKTDIDLTQAVKEKLQIASKKYPVSKSKGNHKKYTELA